MALFSLPSPPYPMGTYVVSLLQARVVDGAVLEIEPRVKGRGVGEDVGVHEAEQSKQLMLQGGGEGGRRE